MTDQHRAGAESVPVRASGQWVRDPLPVRGLHELAQHDDKRSSARHPWGSRVVARGFRCGRLAHTRTASRLTPGDGPAGWHATTALSGAAR